MAAQFGSRVFFRNARDLPGFTKLCDEIESQMKGMFSGFRKDPNKPFTFRVYTSSEFEKRGVSYSLA
jgi:hypothetical protein